MLKYTLCLIRQGTKILLLNRESSAWMGCWNGVGGKLEKDEHPRSSMLREIYEETQIDSPELHFKGLLTWTTTEGTQFGGLYIYLAVIPEDVVYKTPIKTVEGILDWKEIDWILDPKNQGVASSIAGCFEKVLHDDRFYNHRSIFEDDRMVDQISTFIDPRIEEDEALRNTYLNRYIREIKVQESYK